MTAGRALQQGRRHLGQDRRRGRQGHDGAARPSRRSPIATASRSTQESFNSIYMMADSGARGSAAQIRQLAGMRGLMAKPDGSIIETPITANFREGLNVLQYFISHARRPQGSGGHGAEDGELGLPDAPPGRRDAGSGRDRGRLRHARTACAMRALVEGGEVIEIAARPHPRPRRRGRRACIRRRRRRCSRPATMLDEDAVEQLEAAGIDEVKVRTPLTCATRFGLCAKCYGRDLGRGGLVNVGEAVGVIAAQSIGEPGTQLTMRTFHIGGAASRAAVASQRRGQVGRHRSASTPTMRYVTNGKGELVVISRSGEIIIPDDARPRARAPQGAVRRDCCSVKADQHGQGRHGAGQLGSADAADHHRVRRHGEVRERRGRRHGGQAGRRGHRPVDAGRDRSEARAARPRSCARRSSCSTRPATR